LISILRPLEATLKRMVNVPNYFARKTLIQTGSNNKVEGRVYVERERTEERRERGVFVEAAMRRRCKII
jgi:hypothetical protein